MTTPADSPEPPSGPPTFLQVVWSVAAAMFGVQTSKARYRDFTHGKALHYIVVGLVMTLLLIGTILMVVRLLMKNAGM